NVTRWGLVLLIGLLVAKHVMAQNGVVTGSMKNSGGAPISHASVTVCNAQGRVIAFHVSGAAGRFRLMLPVTQPDSLRLKVNHLGYAPIDLPLTPGRERYDLTLTEKAIDLSEVAVKSRPQIDARGDTLSYDVGSFARAEDRNIGDVLRRMPGMEVSENGQIKFNGRNISNF